MFFLERKNTKAEVHMHLAAADSSVLSARLCYLRFVMLCFSSPSPFPLVFNSCFVADCFICHPKSIFFARQSERISKLIFVFFFAGYVVAGSVLALGNLVDHVCYEVRVRTDGGNISFRFEV